MTNEELLARAREALSWRRMELVDARVVAEGVALVLASDWQYAVFFATELFGFRTDSAARAERLTILHGSVFNPFVWFLA